MAPNEHLLDNFSASKETRDLSAQILRLARAKTGPGSGRELRELRVGLPAASILIACEQLNNIQVNKKAAQVASCLKDKEFKKVYNIVQTLLDENERAKNVTYESLHGHYKPSITFDSLKGFIAEVEPEAMLRSGHGPESSLTRCASYFWVLNCVKPKALPDTEIFAQQYDFSVKKFITTLDALNGHCKPLRKKIIAHFKASSSQVTPRRSPRKPVTTSGRDSPLKSSDEPAEARQEGTPIRRSSRTTSSPTKSPLPPPWKKAPIRELPSKDSPKKPRTEAQQQSTTNKASDDVPQTPSKRRKVSPAKPTGSDSSAFLADPSLPGSVVDSPKKSPTVIKVSSPLKRSYAVAISTDVPSESDESESEDPFPRGRFRPVYLEHRQWTAQDPLVASIWKKAEKLRLRQDGLRPSARRRTTRGAT